jgi:hypothetical protein
VFWVEDGAPLKARFDYLKPRTIVDLKRFRNLRERPVDVAIRLAIAEYRYDVQAPHYCDGYRPSSGRSIARSRQLVSRKVIRAVDRSSREERSTGPQPSVATRSRGISRRHQSCSSKGGTTAGEFPREPVWPIII